jgi:hypothetical protein
MPSHRGGPGSIPGHVGLVVGLVPLRHVLSEYLYFPCQLLHEMRHTRPSVVRGWYTRPVSALAQPFKFNFNLYDAHKSPPLVCILPCFFHPEVDRNISFRNVSFPCHTA